MSGPRDSYNQEKSDTFSDIQLENLFASRRVLVWPNLYKAIFHFPISMLLLLVRLIIGVAGFLILSLLPRRSLRRNTIFKGLCKVFGLVVEMDTKHIDEGAKILVANHISLLDRLAVNAMVPCSTITADFQVSSINLSFWKDVDVRYFRDLTDDEIWSLRTSLEKSSIPFLHFPEGASTNGKIGLLKFHPGVFSLNVAVQPVLIQVSFSSFMTVSPTVLGSPAWADVFWTLILPSTYYKLKTLPCMVKFQNESAEEFSKRVQEAMASALNIKPTIFTSSDKVELSKCSQISVSIVSDTPQEQVIDKKSKQNLLVIQRSPQHMLTLNTAAKSFGKSPKERMASYRDRKALLLDAARQKYLEKHS